MNLSFFISVKNRGSLFCSIISSLHIPEQCPSSPSGQLKCHRSFEQCKILRTKIKHWNNYLLIITCLWGGGEGKHHFQVVGPFQSTLLHVLRCWKERGFPCLVFLAQKLVSLNFACTGEGERVPAGGLVQSHRPRTSRRLAAKASFLWEDACR